MVDSTGIIHLRFFTSAAQKNALAEGVRIRCYGEVRRGRSGLEIYHPNTESEGRPRRVGSRHIHRCLPDYRWPSTGAHARRDQSGTEPARSGGRLERLSAPEIIQQFKLLTHRIDQADPSPAAGCTAGMDECRYELRCKTARFRRVAGPPILHAPVQDPYAKRRACPDRGGELVKQFEKTLPFELTASQRQVSAEIEADLMTSTPMLRLLQGDVGSGKTLVAALSALRCLSNGFRLR